ncbi:PTS sugar transporter subunit IIB [[Clostridium] spiroforme]|nr:PTS sugar transporter subunit IIB [Thomasclavelia spiroformis]MBM6879622.1 PTS sugar transporter subunit IIB [Thomasclavelia spiroformis]MBM6930167.1 PTS sugar transporter subunit IIB [Thomasclavelia spiroformis]
MIKILLCCGGGFSSSAIAVRMQKEIKERNLQDRYSITFLPFGLGLKRLDEFDVVILCPHLKVELDKAKKKMKIDKPMYLLPPKMYGLMKFEEIVVDVEDVIDMYQQNPTVPVHFPGEDNLLRITRGVAYRHFKK